MVGLSGVWEHYSFSHPAHFSFPDEEITIFEKNTALLFQKWEYSFVVKIPSSQKNIL